MINLKFKTWCMILPHIIQMSHWCHTMVDGTKFWINCLWLAILSNLNRSQLIQNLTPSTIKWHQCGTRIVELWFVYPSIRTRLFIFHFVLSLFYVRKKKSDGWFQNSWNLRICSSGSGEHDTKKTNFGRSGIARLGQ